MMREFSASKPRKYAVTSTNKEEEEEVSLKKRHGKSNNKQQTARTAEVQTTNKLRERNTQQAQQYRHEPIQPGRK
jgi:hypothetical protein